MMDKLKKFGLSHCDISTMLHNVAVLLRVNTINILREKIRIPLIFYITYSAAIASYLYVYIFSMMWYSFGRCTQTGDLVAASVEFSIGACSAPCCTKFLYLKFCSNTVAELVEEYKECDKFVVPGTRYASNLLKFLRTIKERATALWLILVVNGIIYVGMPLLIPGRHLSEDLFVIYGLEPMFESPNYEMAVLLMFLGVYFAVCTLSNTIVFIVITAGYLEAQLLALSEELDHLWDDSETYYLKMCSNFEGTSSDSDTEVKLRNEFIKIRLRDIVKFHVLTIILRDRLEKELRFIFVVDFLLMMLAIVSELLGEFKNTYLELPYTFVQVFMECLIGQRLIDASNVFETSVYGCQWENFNVANQKTVLTLLHCSQKTLTMSAGGIAVLSFISLMYVIRTTYSAYTTLQSRG